MAVLMLGGCGAASDAVSAIGGGSGLADYAASMEPLVAREADLVDRYDAVSGDNYTDDYTMYEAVTGLLPDVQEFITDLEAVETPTPEIASVHEVLIKGWNAQARGMTLLVAALEDQDYEMVAQANEALGEGRSLMRQYSQELQALAP